MSSAASTSDASVSEDGATLFRQKHIDYILPQLSNLSTSYMTMESSRAWFCFWGLHSLRLLGHRPNRTLLSNIITFLKTCEAENGGYGGAPGHLAHLATTYAAVMALVSIGTDEALASINLQKLRKFLEEMRQPNGCFSVHDDGEADIRATYCAIACAYLTGIATENDSLFSDTATWVVRCQTYEGGFGAEPLSGEAHGGYTFCGLASLVLLKKTHLLDANDTLRWLVNRQESSSGGFQGRTNKLVDGCYSYWQGACFFALEYELSRIKLDNPSFIPSPFFDAEGLQRFVLCQCQDIETGGLRDKPDKYPDLYHTCYALAGLSVAQSYSKHRQTDDSAPKSAVTIRNQSFIVGGEENALEEIHPFYNICLPFYNYAHEYFYCRCDKSL